MTLTGLRHRVGDYLELRAIRKHRSRLGRQAAPQYTDYLRDCQRQFTGTVDGGPAVRAAVESFARDNVASFWTQKNRELASSMMRTIEAQERSAPGPWNDRGQYAADVYRSVPEVDALFHGAIGAFLTGAFRAHFKIYYGIVYRSERQSDTPSGSELWHADGGPGTCIILMVYLHDVTSRHGALECLPWERSLAVYRDERAEYRRRVDRELARGRTLSREELRKIKCDYFEEVIAARYRGEIRQPVGPAGTVVAFGNNVLHRGGYPAPGHVRHVALFHCYPSHRPTDFQRYRTRGIQKTEPYPKDPGAEF